MANMREERNLCTILVGKPEEIRPLERWEDKVRRNSNKEDGRSWSEFVWTRAGLRCRLL